MNSASKRRPSAHRPALRVNDPAPPLDVELPPTGDLPRPLGRPGRLNREMIAAAAYGLGLENVSPRAVAERLGVSVTGLYHYIEGRDDLLRLAAAYAAAQVQVPQDRGQHWAVWITEWALHTRDSFLQEPGLLQQLLAGAIEMNQTAERVDTVLGLLVRSGFAVREALVLYRLTCECAIGAAVELIRERNAAEFGRPVVAEYHRVLAMRPGSLPYLEQVVAERARPVDSLKEALCALVPAFAPPGEDRTDTEAIVATVFDDLGPIERERIAPVENEPATSDRPGTRAPVHERANQGEESL